MGRLAQRWLACARAPRAFSAWLWRRSSRLLPQLVLPCLVFLFLPSRHILELLCSRTRVSASKPAEHYSPAHRGAPDSHSLLSPCHVLGPGQGTSYPCSGDTKAWSSPFSRRGGGGLRGSGVLLESRGWRAQRQASGTVGTLGLQSQSPSTSRRGFSPNIGIMHVHYLSGFAFRIARCWLRD